MDEGGQSLLPQLLLLSWTCGAWGSVYSVSLPAASLCADCGLPLSRHLGMRGPGGQGQTFPSLSLKAQGFPRGMVTATVTGGGHLAQCDLCPTRADQSTSGPVVPAAPATSILHLPTL